MTPDARPLTYNTIQGLRFIAALMVVLCHSTFYVKERLDSGAYFYNLGANGVPLFFVISGFVMIVSSDRLAMRADGWKIFAVKRCERIVPMYWLATTVKLLVLLLGAHLVLHAQLDIGYILKSYFFIPALNVDGHIEPLLGVGWTLMFEMLFYTLFALALFLRVDALAFCSSVFVGLFLLSLVKTEQWPAFDVFASPLVLDFVYGMVIAKLIRAKLHVPNAVCAILGLAGFCFLFLPRIGLLNGLAEGPVVFGMAAAVVVMACVVLEKQIRLAVPNWVTYLGAASYSLYLVHPLITPAVASIMHRQGFDWPILAVAISVMVAVAAGLVAYCWVETPLTGQLKRLGGRPSIDLGAAG